MPRYHRINWRESDTDELTRVVRNFNAKVTRLLKKNPENKNKLPSKVKVSELKSLINTRRDLKREINSLKRFSRRKSEELVTIPNTNYNLEITKWQKKEMNRRVAIINRRRKARLEKISELEVTSRGEGLGYTLSDIGMGKARENALKPMNAFTPGMSYADLKKKWETIQKESQSDYLLKSDFTWRENFIQSIQANFNPEDPRVQELVSTIKNMGLTEWTVKAEAETDVMEFTYPGDKKQEEENLEVLRSTWVNNEG